MLEEQGEAWPEQWQTSNENESVVARSDNMTRKSCEVLGMIDKRVSLMLKDRLIASRTCWGVDQQPVPTHHDEQPALEAHFRLINGQW
jgi:hypothetical protein